MNRRLAIFDPSDMLSGRWVNNFFNNSFDEDDMDLELYEEDDKVVAKFKAPGFGKDNLDLTIEDNILTITGKAHDEEKEEDKKNRYYYRRMEHKSFTRTVRLPARVRAEDAEAEFKDGMVTITMPKAAEAMPKKIKVKTN